MALYQTLPTCAVMKRTEMYRRKERVIHDDKALGIHFLDARDEHIKVRHPAGWVGGRLHVNHPHRVLQQVRLIEHEESEVMPHLSCVLDDCVGIADVNLNDFDVAHVLHLAQ